MDTNFIKRVRRVDFTWRVRFGAEVIYYNDIEDGFNISEYEAYGQIKEYWCNQDELDWVIIKLYERIKGGI